MRQRDAVRAAWFGKSRCWKDHKCWVLGCTCPPRRQRGSRRYMVFFDPCDPEPVWRFACDEHSHGLRRVGRVYKAELKRVARQAERVLARYGSDEQIAAYVAAECERAHHENLSATERMLIEDAPETLNFLRRLRRGLPV